MGKIIGVTVLLLTIIVLAARPADAQSALFQGVRPSGMGGAFITLSDDENALFFNPAGLNDVKGFGGAEILDPVLEISDNSRRIYNDIRNLHGTDIGNVTNFLDQHVGDHQHIQASLFPNLVFHNFAVGLLLNGLADLDVRNRVTPQVNADIHLDAGLLVGVAYGFMDRLIQIGATAKGIRRDGVDRIYTASDIESGNFDPYHQHTNHTAFAFDVGAKMNIPVFLHPTLAIVGQNLGDLDFKQAGSIGHQINLGAAINPGFWILKTTFAAELDDLARQQPDDADLFKRLHLGAELRFPKILSLRAGISQGYYTAGATLDFWLLKVGYANYARELGDYAGQRVDRRQEIQISLGF